MESMPRKWFTPGMQSSSSQSPRTGVRIVPGETTPRAFQSYTVHATPRGQEWRLPLLVSLLEMRDSRWEVNFDEETQKVNKEEIEAMIENVCIGE